MYNRVFMLLKIFLFFTICSLALVGFVFVDDLASYRMSHFVFSIGVAVVLMFIFLIADVLSSIIGGSSVNFTLNFFKFKELPTADDLKVVYK